MRNKAKHQPLDSLRAVLAFCAGKEVARDMDYAEVCDCSPRVDSGAGVVFADGTGLACLAVQDGFGGSDVTPPDPCEIRYFAVYSLPISKDAP